MNSRDERVLQSEKYAKLFGDYQLLLDAIDQCDCTPGERKLLSRAVDDYFRRDRHYDLLVKHRFSPPLIAADPEPTGMERKALDEMVEHHGH